MFKKILHYLRSRPGLCILILLLSIITIANLKQDFYLLGWDNYSSYFNLKTNIFRTFFAAWRQYRGLGVPSDSESTDLFRQLFYLLLSPFVRAQLLDQIYILFALNMGVYIMYFFAGSIFQPYIKRQHTDIIGFITSLFYLFNLNTLATFYFPMIMFINRFYTIPLILYLLLRIIRKGATSTFYDYLFFSFATVVTAGSYMTATVFITFVVVLILFLTFTGRSRKQSVVVFFLFIGLNSFWLFPFANYTIQRSGIVYHAPTFIEANEIQLNKPQSFYSWDKQLILYANFFDTPLSNMQGTQTGGYHPIIAMLNNPAIRVFMFLFPLLYLTGALSIAIKPLQNKKLMWIPLTLFLYLFLTFKAFSPFGFLYSIVEKYLPFFGNLFRFGDTKFHFFIAFAGSLAIGYVCTRILTKVSEVVITTAIFVVAACGIFTYNTYFTGHLFGFFMRNAVPSAYFQLAKMINSDPSSGRVLHLPYDQNGYWRSYSWGYLGSSFLHFMIDHPLLEKTFEPASVENTNQNTEIFDAIAHSQVTDTLLTYQEKTTHLYDLLKKTGVKYIIFDGTVSAEQPTKGLHLWGKYNTVDSERMLSHMLEMGYVKRTASFAIPIANYANTYEKVFPLNQDEMYALQTEHTQSLNLYELTAVDPLVRMSASYVAIDNQSTQINVDSHVDTIQKEGMSGSVQPFQLKNKTFNFRDGMASLMLGTSTTPKGSSFTITLPQSFSQQNDQTMIILYGTIEQNTAVFTFYAKPTPDIVVGEERDQNLIPIRRVTIPISKLNEALLSVDAMDTYLSNWHELPYDAITALRLQVGNTIIPVPRLAKGSTTYIGALVVPVGATSVAALIPEKYDTFGAHTYEVTDNPNCFGDGDTTYSYKQSVGLNNDVTFTTVNGSTCFLTHLTPLNTKASAYAELHFNYSARQKDLDSYNNIQTSKPHVLHTVEQLSKPAILSVCLKDISTPTCYNTHQAVRLGSQGGVTIPTEMAFSAFDPVAFFALKNVGHQSQTVTLSSAQLTSYRQVYQEEITIPSYAGQTYSFQTPRDGTLMLTFDQPMGSDSYYQGQQDGYYVSNSACTKRGSYRTFRTVAGTTMSYFVNCDTNFAVPLAFSGSTTKAWSIDYNLASGKFPRFALSDGFITYASEYLSLYQGYPSIPGFMQLQNPESLFTSPSQVVQSIEKPVFTPASIVIAPHPEYQDSAIKNFSIAQDSENEGIALYKNLRIMGLPGSWYGMTIAPLNNTSVQSESNATFTVSPLIPSLWKVKSAKPAQGMIVFNEAYDSQWGLYGSMTDIILGRMLSATHYKCNGYANCFDLSSNQEEFYIFYWPEKLTFLGWIVTIGTICFLWLRTRRSLIRNT